MEHNKRTVLMLNKDADDHFITEWALAESGYTVSVKFVTSSEELFASLTQAFKPSLIIVDYNSRPDNGLIVLQQLKGDKQYNHIPVVILSETNLPEYVAECYKAGASSFIKKPSTIALRNQQLKLFSGIGWKCLRCKEDGGEQGKNLFSQQAD